MCNLTTRLLSVPHAFLVLSFAASRAPCLLQTHAVSICVSHDLPVVAQHDMHDLVKYTKSTSGHGAELQ